MENRNLFTTTSEKSIAEFIESLKANGPTFGISVRHVFDMKEEFRRNHIDVDDHFEVFQIMVCSFERSYLAMITGMERAAVLLQPKQIVVYTKERVTNISYLPFTEEFVKQALPEDTVFYQGLPEMCQKIIQLIEMSK